MKMIKAFILTSGRGFFIDLEDAKIAVTVTPNSGDIVLHEGSGSDRLHGVCIPGRAVEEFDVDRVNGTTGVFVWYRQGEQNKKRYLLGLIEDRASAEMWVRRVNLIYKNREKRESRTATSQEMFFKLAFNPKLSDDSIYATTSVEN